MRRRTAQKVETRSAAASKDNNEDLPPMAVGERYRLLSKGRAAPERRLSAITGQAMWFNRFFYFRLALAVNTAVACLHNGQSVVCIGSGKSSLSCFFQ